MDYASHSHESAKLFHVDFRSSQCDGHDVQKALANWKGGDACGVPSDQNVTDALPTSSGICAKKKRKIKLLENVDKCFE